MGLTGNIRFHDSFHVKAREAGRRWRSRLSPAELEQNLAWHREHYKQNHVEILLKGKISRSNDPTYKERMRVYAKRRRARLKEHPEVYSKIKERFRQRHPLISRVYRARLKRLVLSRYSPELKCQTCGHSDIRALSIDHINGGGTKHRASLGVRNIYGWLKKNSYPEGFQVLCMNCQFVKRMEKGEMRHGSVC